MMHANTMTAAAVFLIKNNQVFLMQRIKTGLGNEQYAGLGGAHEIGESIKQTAIRESFEEAGVTLAPQDLNFIHVFHRRVNDTQDCFVFFFAAFRWQGEPFNKEPHKHADAIWAPLDNLPSNMWPHHKQALEHWQKNSYYSEIDWEK